MTMWRNRGDTALWQIIHDFGLCAQNKPHLSLCKLGIGQEALLIAYCLLTGQYLHDQLCLRHHMPLAAFLSLSKSFICKF